MLLAMATGTGKTKLAIAMLYRLLATKRFRRICFVVDRSRAGQQAAGRVHDHQGRLRQDLRRHLRAEGPGGRDARDRNQGPHLHHPGAGEARALRRGRLGGAAGRSIRPDGRRRVPPRLSARPRDVGRGAELPRPGRLHLQVPARAGVFRRREDRPHRHAGAAHDRNLRRSDLHLLLSRGGHRRLPDRPRAAGADRDRARPSRHRVRRRTSSSSCSNTTTGEIDPRPRARRNPLRGRAVQQAGRHQPSSTRRCRGAGQAHRPGAPGQDADLRCHRRAMPTSWSRQLKKAFAKAYGEIDDAAVRKITGSVDNVQNADPLLPQRRRSRRSPSRSICSPPASTCPPSPTSCSCAGSTAASSTSR